MSCPNNIEIERKFLVRDDSYKALATSSVHIRQGYLSRSANCTVRVRCLEHSKCLEHSNIPAEATAFLTIKSAPAANGFAHYEFEKEITVHEANELLQLALPGIIDKRRWLVPLPPVTCNLPPVPYNLPPVPCNLSPATCPLPPATCNLLVCEVDEFFGDNAGLVMAEVELPSEDTPFAHPDFLGDEVTFDKRYYNSYLSQHPFITW